MFILCKDNKKDDTMCDRNVKMWMNFSFLDRNVSDNEMDKKNGEYIKSGCGIDENAKKSIYLLCKRLRVYTLHNSKKAVTAD